ncbi:hypothetical protein PENANT_c034G08391, partial [Penicillium antarcticum]
MPPENLVVSNYDGIVLFLGGLFNPRLRLNQRVGKSGIHKSLVSCGVDSTVGSPGARFAYIAAIDYPVSAIVKKTILKRESTALSTVQANS